VAVGTLCLVSLLLPLGLHLFRSCTSACGLLLCAQEGVELGQTGACALAILRLSHAIAFMPEVADELARRAGIKQRCFVHAGVAPGFNVMTATANYDNALHLDMWVMSTSDVCLCMHACPYFVGACMMCALMLLPQGNSVMLRAHSCLSRCFD